MKHRKGGPMKRYRDPWLVACVVIFLVVVILWLALG